LRYYIDAGQDAPCKYTAPLAWSTWNGLNGGSSLGLLVEAMEQVSGMPLFSVSCQYVNLIKQGDEVTALAEILSSGKSAMQMRATLTGPAGVQVCAIGTVGAMTAEAEVFAPRDEQPPPEQSTPRPWMKPLPGSLMDTLDVRVASHSPDRVGLWIRYPAGAGKPMSASLLATFADHPPFGLSFLLGNQRYGISLDSSYRTVTPPEGFDAAGWVQLDMHYDFIGPQFALATVRLWSQSGALLGVANQAMRIRQGMVSPSKK